MFDVKFVVTAAFLKIMVFIEKSLKMFFEAANA